MYLLKIRVSPVQFWAAAPIISRGYEISYPLFFWVLQEVLYKAGSPEEFEGTIGHFRESWGIMEIFNVMYVLHDLFI